mmetsp:Transcript_12122/g.17671  ORF Transcript_12122/g.17671 Transcript_12122/m.17671 type:complete len:204 (-) Transcript_12122:13-624(-)
MENLSGVPPVTKYICLLMLVCSSLSSMQLVSSYNFSLSWSHILKKLQLWRLVTSFTYIGPFSFMVAVHILIFFQDLRFMETRSSFEDMVYFVLWNWVSGLVLSSFGFKLVSEIFFMCVVYINSKRNRNARATLFFLPMLQIPVHYLPWIFLVLNFSYERVIGVAMGHLYYYFEDIYPKLSHSHGFRLFAPPRVLRKAIRAVLG